MSKYLVYTLVPYSVPYDEIQTYAMGKLEPYRISGDRWGWFDYLCRIERREPFNDRETEYRLPDRVRRSLQGHICDISKVCEAEQPLALVDLEGKWNAGAVRYDEYRIESGELRPEFAEATRVARVAWPRRYAEILQASPPCWVLALWAHS